MNIYKIIFIAILLTTNSKMIYAFDLKSLTDKIQKDIGSKLQVPKGGPSSGNSNPLGGLLNNLNTNNSGSSSSNMSNISQSSSSSGETKLAKGVCEPNIDKIIKNLPKGNFLDLVNDFNGQNKDEISKILNTSPASPDRFVETLATYDGAFETKEVEEVFSSFISTKNIDHLATLKAMSEIDGGMNKNKKQIKVDAQFAYGLVHYFYYKNGSNKSLGINLIKKSAGSTSNIGGLTLYGAWQFFGINVNKNIQAGVSNTLEGYNRASDKNRETLVSGPFYQMKKSKYPETIFLEIAANDENPYKQQYQNQLAQASQMNKDVINTLKNSEKYDKKSGWWPSLVAQQNRQYTILNKLGENLGLGKELSTLNAKYAGLASKISQSPTNAQIVEEMVIVNQAMIDKVEKALNSAKEVDEKGKKQIVKLASANELLILKNQSLTFSIMGNMLAQGGFGSGFFELTKMVEIIGGNRNVACRTYTSVKNYAERTKIIYPKPITNEDEPEGNLGGTTG